VYTYRIGQIAAICTSLVIFSPATCTHDVPLLVVVSLQQHQNIHLLQPGDFAIFLKKNNCKIH
jgi:hypothetical protein